MKDKNKAPVSLINKIDTNRISSLCRRVIGHIDQARQYVQRTIDTEMVKAYWLIGQEIVQEEQFGNDGVRPDKQTFRLAFYMQSVLP